MLEIKEIAIVHSSYDLIEGFRNDIKYDIGLNTVYHISSIEEKKVQVVSEFNCNIVAKDKNVVKINIRYLLQIETDIKVKEKDKLNKILSSELQKRLMPLYYDEINRIFGRLKFPEISFNAFSSPFVEF